MKCCGHTRQTKKGQTRWKTGPHYDAAKQGGKQTFKQNKADMEREKKAQLQKRKEKSGSYLISSHLVSRLIHSYMRE